MLARILVFFFTLIGALSLSAGELPPDLAALLDQLGGEGFRSRKAAEQTMKELPRDAIQHLQPIFETTDDPEIKIRLGRIIEHIMTSPGKIPSVYKVLVIEDKRAFTEAAEDWRGEQEIATLHTNGQAGTGGDFAQSFIPNCESIAGIEVCTYALSDGFGWMRLDLVTDDNGKPSEVVLARSWVKIPKKHNFPHGGYVLHDLPSTPIKSNQRYWMIYYDFPEPEANATFLNFGLSIKQDAYADGKLWRAGSRSASDEEDVKFRILSKAKPFTAYRKPSEAELETLPKEAHSNITWPEIQAQSR